MSLTEAQAIEAICQRWKAVWDTLHSSDPDDETFCPYTFENRKALEPSAQGASWARVVFRQEDSNQHTLGVPGRRQWKREGAVWVSLYRPVLDGTSSLATLCDHVRQVFEGASFDGIDPNGSPRMQTVGADGKWFEVVMICPITYYETR